MKERIKREDYVNQEKPITRTVQVAHNNIPNGVLCSLMGRNDQGNVSPNSREDQEKLRQAVRSRLPIQSLQNQRPAAESEADRFAKGIPYGTPESVKTTMGQRLDTDFSEVRFHTDPQAMVNADTIGARAYTSGKDVYFGSEGFNAATAAHELVHTVQQGAVESPVSTVTAPMGEVQMMPKFLKKLWGNAKEERHDGASRPKAPAPETLKSLLPQLTATKETQKLFKGVAGSASKSVKGKFGNKKEKDMAMVTNAVAKYEELIETSKSLIEGADPHNNAPNPQVDLAKKVLQRAALEKMAVQNARIKVAGMSAAERKTLNWDSILSGSAAAVLDGSQIDRNKLAGNAGNSSTVYELGNEDGHRYFKPSTRIAAGENVKELQERVGKGDKDAQKELNASDMALALESSILKDKTGNEYYETGSRNLATSVYANLLGIGKLTAESREAALDPGGGSALQSGIVSDEAIGYGPRIYGMPEKQKLDALVQRDVSTGQVFDYLCGQADHSGGNVRFGSVDAQGRRNKGSNVVNKVTFFDNDASFGMNPHINVNYRKEKTLDGEHATFTQEGRLTLPHLDAKFAEQVMAMEPDLLKASLKGLISEEETEAAIERLYTLQDAIKKEMDDKESNVLIEDSEWGVDTHRALAPWTKEAHRLGKLDDKLKVIEKRNITDRFASSYYEEYLYNMAGYGAIGNFGNGDKVGEALPHINDELAGGVVVNGGALMTPEQRREQRQKRGGYGTKKKTWWPF
ncbi:DUF4157 domain-containing protein [Desulfosporosinus sp. PR]|uniref:eCIS core domain-containing protein n=1 Tax=Candidatus Desulfosporosinus nitrosoreducens TaxID=3401928 RepID=UPI0027EB7DFA|nr:DUF4157 domain-containing protein [Desulfosporosinus sp. PR]MDQ7096474.1 DUF4157 domain-containing protein [Desulfosporosinus sp. PR]